MLQLTKFEQFAYDTGYANWKDQLHLSAIVLLLLIVAVVFLIWQKSEKWTLIVMGVLTFSCFFYCVYASKACIASENVEQRVELALQNMEEELIAEEVVEISAFNANKEMEGYLKGEYRMRQGTIYGQITNKTELSYVGVTEKGSLYMDSIPYSPDNVDIYENDEEKPRIEIRTYQKRALDKVVERTEYTIYIPSGTLSEI